MAATTAVNVEEIVRGLRAAESDAARRLFDGLTVLPNDAGTARRAGIWRRDHATRGITLYPADNLITAASHANRAAPVTANPKDFPMDEVLVQHWPVGR